MKTLLMFVLILFAVPLFLQAQQPKDYTEEYAVLNEVFLPSDFDLDFEFVELFHFTSELRIWIYLLDFDRNLFLGPGCNEVKHVIHSRKVEIEEKADWIPNFELDTSRLSKRIKITTVWDPKTKKVTVPLIVGNYAFVFVHNEKSQFVVALTKNNEGEWRQACNILIYTPPLVDVSPVRD